MQPISFQTEAYRCAACERVHLDKATAEACCTCQECGGPRGKGGRFKPCPACVRKREIKRTRSALAHARDALAREHVRYRESVAEYERQIKIHEACLLTLGVKPRKAGNDNSPRAAGAS